MTTTKYGLRMGLIVAVVTVVCGLVCGFNPFTVYLTALGAGVALGATWAAVLGFFRLPRP
jgi:hypothetical protein